MIVYTLIMKRNIHTLRLKDIENISKKDVDYSIIMKEVIGYNNFYIGRRYRFAKAFKKAFYLVTNAQKIDPAQVLLKKELSIKIPNSVDNISFRAMMELQSLFGNYRTENDFGCFVAKIISIVCYQENNKEDYISSSESFKNFYESILEKPIWEMVGIYNWIEKNLEESSLEWTKRFMSVEVEDQDYQLAGGQRMNQFNVITTIKAICLDFNCNYDEAWQMSYALTQTNSYAKATANHIQDQMRQVKEAKMKKQRSSH